MNYSVKTTHNKPTQRHSLRSWAFSYTEFWNITQSLMKVNRSIVIITPFPRDFLKKCSVHTISSKHLLLLFPPSYVKTYEPCEASTLSFQNNAISRGSSSYPKAKYYSAPMLYCEPCTDQTNQNQTTRFLQLRQHCAFETVRSGLTYMVSW